MSKEFDKEKEAEFKQEGTGSKPREPKSKPSGKKSGKKGYKPKKEGTDQKQTKTYGGNDVSWYTKYPSLVMAASSIIFNKPYGSVLHNKDSANGAFTGTADYNTAVPGGYVARFANSLTSDGSAESPLNVATKNFYTFVRHANSGSANYESSDLMQYLLSVISLYPIVEDLKRDLKLILTYKATNRYVYRSLLYAKGYTTAAVDTLVVNYAQYVSRLNILIAQLNSFKVPKDISLISRREWLSSMVFKDDELDKASLYMFAPNDYLKYDWANARLLTQGYNPQDWNTAYGMVVTEINNLLSIEDVGIMLGDILKAYGDQACHYTAPIHLDEVIDAVYSQEAGEQFRNLCCTGLNPLSITYRQNAANSQLLETVQTYDGTDYIGRYMYVDTNNPAYSDIKATIPVGYKMYPILMADADMPNNDKVLVNTRLQWINQLLGYYDAASSTDTDDILYNVVAHGTEVIVKVSAFKYCSDVENTTVSFAGTDSYRTYFLTGMNSVMSSSFATVTALYPTRFAPQYNGIIAYGGVVPMAINLFDGLNNIVLEENWLSNLHQGCLMSLLTLPMFRLLESK